MELYDDFDFIHHDIRSTNAFNDHDKENFDFPICHSTPSIYRSKQEIRSVDFPSLKKHYGIVTFFDYQLLILYRLLNDTSYVPYIRFSYVLNIFEHSSYKKYLVNIRNLPIIEMTTTEKTYYDQLSSSNNDSDWSNCQLLSVSMLDSVLGIINLVKHFHCRSDLSSTEQSNEWQEAMNMIRQEARERWILDEKIVLARLKEKKDVDSTCISSTSMAKRRALFEQRLDLSIVDEVGGFIQIDAFIYPFIKNSSDHQIYINLDDIRQNYISLPSYLISYTDQNSPMYRSYSIVIDQAQTNYEWNRIHRGHNNDLSKVLPIRKRSEENLCDQIPFLPLQTLLHLFLNKHSNLNVQFIQLFETSSLNEIELNYKNNVARQFILAMKRQGGFVNGNVPCLISSSKENHRILFIPSETKTRRVMIDDERLYLNMILLYHGLWKNLLTKKKQWFFKEIDGYDKENINLEILFNNENSR